VRAAREFTQRVFGTIVGQQALAELRVLVGIQRLRVIQRLQHGCGILLASGLVEPARQFAQRRGSQPPALR
jgi:hypothetical protein